MPKYLRVLILLLIGYTALAQPGIPPCWLEAKACEFHPHPFGHPEVPHSHGYLLDLSAGYAVQLAPVNLTPVSLLIALLSLFSVWRLLYSLNNGGISWAIIPESPPPRLLIHFTPASR